LNDIDEESLGPDVTAVLQPVIDFRNQNLKHFFRAQQVAQLKDTVVLHAMGNGMEWSLISQAVEGDANVGMIFFEYTEASPEACARLGQLNATVAGSTWNAELLKSWGVRNVETVFQGVDTEAFRPRVKQGTHEGRFAVFSGGKLDFRKGQDIVLAAFKAFSDRHDDAVLVTAWQNLWPLTALQMGYSPHLSTLPHVAPDNSMNFTRWAGEHGIAPEKFIDLGLRPNAEMPSILREVDLAVFPNRCEGGTNLVAMEAMACGVPCVVAANTGQLDLLGDAEKDNHCYALADQSPVAIPGFATEGWGETSVEELVEAMEHAYQNRSEIKTVGQAGADFMRKWDWPTRIGELLEKIDAHC